MKKVTLFHGLKDFRVGKDSLSTEAIFEKQNTNSYRNMKDFL